MPVRDLLSAQEIVVFIAEDGASCKDPFAFHNCLKAGSLSRSAGASEFEYCDPECCDYDVPVARITGVSGAWSLTLSGRMPKGQPSVLRDLHKQECPADVRLNMTYCGTRRDINNFDHTFWLKDAIATNYSTSELGATTPNEKKFVTEQVTLTFPIFAEFPRLDYGFIDGFQGTVTDVLWCNPTPCDDCENGCLQPFASVIGDDGNIHLWFSLDGGNNWSRRLVASGTGILDVWVLCVDEVIHVVTTSATGTNVYALDLADINETNTSFVYVAKIDALTSATGVDAYDGKIYIAGATGVAVVDASHPYGAATSNPFATVMTAVTATSNGVYVGGVGGYIYKLVGDDWIRIPGADSADITAINKQCGCSKCDGPGGCLMYGDTTGNVYVSTDDGCTWFLKGDFGESIDDIEFDCH